MGNRIIAILAALALFAPVSAATAGSKSPKLAKCDGKQRRPANPHGSILPSVDPLRSTSTPAEQKSERSGVEVFPEQTATGQKPVSLYGKPDAQVPPISSLPQSTTNQSC